MSGEKIKNSKVVADILAVFTTNAASAEASSESVSAFFIKVMLMPHIIAVAKAIKTPLNKIFLVTLFDLFPS